MKFYMASPPKLWGDYGLTVLASGISSHLPRTQDGLVQLERTGPLMPPFTLPAAIIISDEMRRLLESARLGVFDFKPVIKTRIVEFYWDPASAGPPHVDFDGRGPSSIILDGEHSDTCSESLGDVWELILPRVDGFSVTIKKIKGLERYECNQRSLSFWKGPHLFYPDPGRHCIVTDIGKEFLEKECHKWIEFDELQME